MGPGLALEQAPPFSVPLRFLLGAPWFLVAAGLLAAWVPDWSGSPLHPATLALTHLVTLGYLGMVMLGALTQMLPVVAGAPVPAVRPVALISHLGLVAGTLFLVWGLYAGEPTALQTGGLLLGLGLSLFLAAALASLPRGRDLDTLRAMGLALAALALTLAFGLTLVGWLTGLWQPEAPLAWLERHVLAGLAGWIGILVMGTAWQVVPMLQITTHYPARLTRGLLIAAAASLIATLLLPPPWQILGQAGLSGCAIVFAVTTLELLRRRRRKIPDAGLYFWRLSMSSLGLAAALYPFASSDRELMLAGLLFLPGFAVSVVNGMLYKIVPFLAWFHLRAQKGMLARGLPSMKDYLSDAATIGQFRLHALALACLLPTPYLPVLTLPGGLLLAASAAWAGWNLLSAVRLFRRLGGTF